MRTFLCRGLWQASQILQACLVSRSSRFRLEALLKIRGDGRYQALVRASHILQVVIPNIFWEVVPINLHRMHRRPHNLPPALGHPNGAFGAISPDLAKLRGRGFGEGRHAHRKVQITGNALALLITH